MLTRRGQVKDVDPRVIKVIEIMGRNLHRHLPVGSMAASVNLSYSRLAHLFKTETGMTPVSYLKKLRIERARELLETTFLTNQQIVIKVGLCDASHFIKDLRRLMVCDRANIESITTPSAIPVPTAKRVAE